MMKITRTLVLSGLFALALSAGMANAQNLTPSDEGADYWDHNAAGAQVQRDQSPSTNSGAAAFGHQRHPDGSVAR